MRSLLKLLLWLGLASCAATPTHPAAPIDLIDIPTGLLQQGDPAGEPDEAPRDVKIAAFRIMRHEVTNALFATFVTASGHITDAERSGFGWVWSDRWRRVVGADWRHPAGPGSSIADLAAHPVVQVSQWDAAAFCAFHGLRLPRDAEWEYAARGQDQRRYPWGDAAPEQTGQRRANFGSVTCCAPDESDGYARTAPVGTFPEGVSPFGAQDMAGNVWEWLDDPYPPRRNQVALRGGGWGNNPYCLRVSYRHGNPPDIGLDMVGFRCAAAPLL